MIGSRARVRFRNQRQSNPRHRSVINPQYDGNPSLLLCRRLRVKKALNNGYMATVFLRLTPPVCGSEGIFLFAQLSISKYKSPRNRYKLLEECPSKHLQVCIIVGDPEFTHCPAGNKDAKNSSSIKTSPVPTPPAPVVSASSCFCKTVQHF